MTRKSFISSLFLAPLAAVVGKKLPVKGIKFNHYGGTTHGWACATLHPTKRLWWDANRQAWSETLVWNHP